MSSEDDIMVRNRDEVEEEEEGQERQVDDEDDYDDSSDSSDDNEDLSSSSDDEYDSSHDNRTDGHEGKFHEDTDSGLLSLINFSWDYVLEIVKNVKSIRDHSPNGCVHIIDLPPIVSGEVNDLYEEWEDKLLSNVDDCMSSGEERLAKLGGETTDQLLKTLDINLRYLIMGLDLKDKLPVVQLLKRTLFKTGTNLLLLSNVEGEKSSSYFCVAWIVAASLLLLDAIIADVMQDPTALQNFDCRTKDMQAPNKRGVIRYFSKRIGCDCLKQWYKSYPRVYFCEYCLLEKNTSDLKQCSLCKVDNYCSKECQIADWPKHKIQCNKYRAQESD